MTNRKKNNSHPHCEAIQEEFATAVNGILLLNKSTGCSSNHALQAVRRLFGKRKAGHTGCLDPLATGMLPICLGEATKFSQYLLNQDKIYETTAVLGVVTSTGDADGEVVARQDASCCTLEQLEKVLPSFQGEIEQVPPMYSALKHQGVPLYRLARKGQVVERSSRQVRVHDITVLDFSSSTSAGGSSAHPTFALRVHCSKGTYIRTLVEDIGHALGVGAYVSQLHRVSTAGFENEKMYTLEELARCSEAERNALILPMISAVADLPSMMVTQEQQAALYKGQTISCSLSLLSRCLVSLCSEMGVFFGVGEYEPTGLLTVNRLIRQELR